MADKQQSKPLDFRAARLKQRILGDVRLCMCVVILWARSLGPVENRLYSGKWIGKGCF